jgi:hypothetical protein
MHPIDRDFQRHFNQTQKTVKRIGSFTVFLVILQLILYLAIAAGIIYFIVYALTHWMKW